MKTTSARKLEEMLDMQEYQVDEFEDEFDYDLDDEFDEDEDIEELDPELQEGEEGTLDEVRAQRVVRFKGGKRMKMLDCPKGYRLQGGRCVRMSASQRNKLSRVAKKRARKMAGRQAAISRKRSKSMARRRNAGL